MSTSGTENGQVLKNNIHTIPNLSARFLFFACKNGRWVKFRRVVLFSSSGSNGTEDGEQTDLRVGRTSRSGTRQGSEALLPLLQPFIFLHLESQTSPWGRGGGG